ncbi:hypothetical protein [Litoreibacter roseus]|uniref:Uncharacterized protein n=1 Tax=Litoreibacter roseus TaxID=2601869 RepID=A0A6N6JCP0_9RHOB|nr:hypothetical protein [Litoreibacter roseus]GFE63189.1 hypothetical protein KIN_02630 [Litoreibacter roseus]
MAKTRIHDAGGDECLTRWSDSERHPQIFLELKLLIINVRIIKQASRLNIYSEIARWNFDARADYGRAARGFAAIKRGILHLLIDAQKLGCLGLARVSAWPEMHSVAAGVITTD